MFCGKCEKKVDGMHQLFCDPRNRFANPYVCKQCLDEINMDEMQKCKDPVYFYENYWLVDGKKPMPLTDCQREIIRHYAAGRTGKAGKLCFKKSRQQ